MLTTSDARDLAEVSVVATRNNSLSLRGRVCVLGALIAMRPAVGVACTARGPWPVLPFSGLELVALLLAFGYEGFTKVLQSKAIQISMHRNGRWVDKMRQAA
jgi:uncharacterized membrane protein